MFHIYLLKENKEKMDAIYIELIVRGGRSAGKTIYLAVNEALQ